MLKQKKGYSNIIEIQQKCNQQKHDYISLKPPSSTCRPPNQKIIKFVGDLKHNIEQILSSIRCNGETKQQFKEILMIYAGKIQKLREQRNLYRNMLHYKGQKQNEQVLKLQQQIKRLQSYLNIMNANQQNYMKCTCQHAIDNKSQRFSQHTKHNSKVVSQQNNTFKPYSNDITEHYFNQIQKSYKHQANQLNLHQKPQSQTPEELLVDNIFSKKSDKQEDSLMISRSQNCTEISNTAITQQQLLKLMFKYNISIEELENIFEGYQNQYKMPFELYDEQKQQKLYRLGQKMQKDLNNKKVLKDLKNISGMKGKMVAK